MMFGLGSFNLINEFERTSNEPNAKQIVSSSVRLQPYARARARVHWGWLCGWRSGEGSLGSIQIKT